LASGTGGNTAAADAGATSATAFTTAHSVDNTVSGLGAARQPPQPGHDEQDLESFSGASTAPVQPPLLSAPDEVYTKVAATTAEDLAVLAPTVPASTRIAIAESDPTLDADVAAWFSDTCDLPRLTLLGPVLLRANGAAIAKRRPFYTELVAYLASRPSGATTDEVAAAFNLQKADTVRNAAKIVRDWLGRNPRTGELHLPHAPESAAGKRRGVGVYQIDGLLVDADLFRRLRVRGQARGADGIADLRTALTLVSGQILDQLRPGGWSWMYEGDRLDHHLISAVVDVAHIVTTHGLATGDLAIAREAVTAALRAAPYEEISRLDLAAVTYSEGHHTRARQIIDHEVCNRTDDDGPPLDLSPRTMQVLANHEDWVRRREAS
jgi:hypothetical protein